MGDGILTTSVWGKFRRVNGIRVDRGLGGREAEECGYENSLHVRVAHRYFSTTAERRACVDRISWKTPAYGETSPDVNLRSDLGREILNQHRLPATRSTTGL